MSETFSETVFGRAENWLEAAFRILNFIIFLIKVTRESYNSLIKVFTIIKCVIRLYFEPRLENCLFFFDESHHPIFQEVVFPFLRAVFPQ